MASGNACAKARELKASGVKVYDFSLGEPDFDTPRHIIDAANKAVLAGQTHYTPTSGTAECLPASSSATLIAMNRTRSC